MNKIKNTKKKIQLITNHNPLYEACVKKKSHKMYKWIALNLIRRNVDVKMLNKSDKTHFM